MNITKAKRIQLAKMLALVKEIKTDEGEMLYIEGDLAVDTEVFVADGDGNMVPAPDGTYTAEGKSITIVAGKITEIKEIEAPAAEEEQPAEEVATEEEQPAEEQPAGDGEEIDVLKARVAELEAIIAEKDAKITELEAEIAEYKKNEETPAAESIEEEEKKRKFRKEGKESTLTERILAVAYK